MPQTTNFEVTIDPELKANAEAILKDVGISPTEAVTMFLKLVVRGGELPFSSNTHDVKVELPADQKDARLTLHASLGELFAAWYEIMDKYGLSGIPMSEEVYLQFDEWMWVRCEYYDGKAHPTLGEDAYQKLLRQKKDTSDN